MKNLKVKSYDDDLCPTAKIGQKIYHLILPAFTLSLMSFAHIALHTRQKLIDVLNSEYVLFARARGEGKWTILKRHGFRNILIPALTLQFASFAELFGGSVMAENVFSYPGLGSAVSAAGLSSDVPLLLGVTLFSALFVCVGNMIANLLYGIMNTNIDIPSADLFVVRFKGGDQEYLALLKMNFKASYTHRTLADGDNNKNDIIRYKAVLPTETQKLSEAAIINLHTKQVQVVEKKYEVNGEKTNYFSYLFLKCSSHLSHLSRKRPVFISIKQKLRLFKLQKNFFTF